MENLVSQLKTQFSKEIKSFGITEIFVINNESYFTSSYDLPNELISKIESIIL